MSEQFVPDLTWAGWLAVHICGHCWNCCRYTTIAGGRGNKAGHESLFNDGGAAPEGEEEGGPGLTAELDGTPL